MFHRTTQPVIEYYRGRLVTVDGGGIVDQVNRAMLESVQPWTAHV